MWRSSILLIVGMLCSVSPAVKGQYLAQFQGSPQSAMLSGNLRMDMEETARKSLALQDTTSHSRSPKSGLQAAAFSILLPGAGEYYVGDYWKAGSFLAAEVGLWIAYAVYEGKGDRQTELFELYADEHFWVDKYAQWIIDHGRELNPNAQIPDGIISNPHAPRRWERVDWAKLNSAEASIGQKTGTFFSHQLPRRPEQQYYELIGKYGQYNPGWEDANVNATNFHTDLTRMFLDYSKMRGEANDFYNIAGTAAKLLVVNHVLSALDAAWSAAQHNKTLTMEAHLRPTMRPFGIVEFVPTAQLSVSF